MLKTGRGKAADFFPSGFLVGACAERTMTFDEISLRIMTRKLLDGVQLTEKFAVTIDETSIGESLERAQHATDGIGQELVVSVEIKMVGRCCQFKRLVARGSMAGVGGERML